MEKLTYRGIDFYFKNGRFTIKESGFSSTDYSDMTKYIDDSFLNLVEVFHITELKVKHLSFLQVDGLCKPVTEDNRQYIKTILELKEEIDRMTMEKFNIIFKLISQL